MQSVTYKYINSLNDNEKLEILKSSPTGWEIGLIDNPTEEMQLIAIDKEASNILFINNPTINAQLRATLQNYHVLKYFKNPAREVLIKTLDEYPEAIQYIDNPDEELQLIVISKSKGRGKRHGEKSYYNILMYIENPSKKVQEIAIDKDAENIQYIKNPSDETIKRAIKKDPKTIYYIKNQTKEQQQLAFELGCVDIRYYNIATLDIDFLLKLVKAKPDNITRIDNQSEILQEIAVTQDPSIISLIKNPSDKIKWIALKNSTAVYKYFYAETDEMIEYSIKEILEKDFESMPYVDVATHASILKSFLIPRCKNKTLIEKILTKINKSKTLSDVINKYR